MATAAMKFFFFKCIDESIRGNIMYYVLYCNADQVFSPHAELVPAEQQPEQFKCRAALQT